MRYFFIVLAMLSLNLFAYSDMDMDGVDDAHDQCPNTPLTDLVDARGCSIKSLKTNQHFDIIFGAAYSEANYNTNENTDTTTSSVQLDYYYKNYSLQLSTSYFNSDSKTYDDSGMNDTLIAGYYQFTPVKSLLVRVGAGILLPTYDSNLNNNNTDYTASANLSYTTGKINLFGGYAYTLVNDDDINTADLKITYQNTNAAHAGVGYYFTPKIYASVSYNATDSIYENVDTIETASIYGYYSINKHWFTTLSYAYGLSDSASDNYIGVRVGYYF